MDSKLIFFDIDGTLALEPSGIIPDSTRAAIAGAKENGHQVFVNTGRTFYSISEGIRAMDFDGYVCGCGTHIYYRGKKLLESAVPHSMCVNVANMLRNARIPVFYEADKAIYFDFSYPNPWLQEAMEIFATKGRNIEELFCDESETYDKCLIFLPDTEEAGEVKTFLDAHFYCIPRGGNVWEVTQRGYTKATGIRFMCSYLNADMDNCFAVGDSENDLDMLRVVKNSIAMGNAKDEVMACCSYVTKGIDEDGIYYALKHFGIIK